jgi:hypothetical protein
MRLETLNSCTVYVAITRDPEELYRISLPSHETPSFVTITLLTFVIRPIIVTTLSSNHKAQLLILQSTRHPRALQRPSESKRRDPFLALRHPLILTIPSHPILLASPLHNPSNSHATSHHITSHLFYQKITAILENLNLPQQSYSKAGHPSAYSLPASLPYSPFLTFPFKSPNTSTICICISSPLPPPSSRLSIPSHKIPSHYSAKLLCTTDMRLQPPLPPALHYCTRPL